MIRQALSYEIASIFRSPAAVVGILAFFAACAFAIFSGQQFQKEWMRGIEEASVRQSESIEQVRGWFAKGAKGPADRAWVDIRQPAWQDWYAGTRLVRLPSKLAGIAAGSIDDSPRVLTINRRTDPFLSEGAEIENPELGRTERLDLAFVFSVFIPLLVGLLGIGCGARERESGIVRLIAVQRGNASSWFLARAVAVTVISSIVVTLSALASVFVAQVPLVEGLGLIGLGVLYTVLWCGLLTATAVAASNMREAATIYGIVWLLLVVLLPAVLAERAISAEAASPEIETSLDAREDRYEMFGKGVNRLLPELYRAHPSLRISPVAKSGNLPSSTSRLVYDGIANLRLVDRHESVLQVEEQALADANRGMFLSPALALTLAMEAMAGRDLRSAMEFRTAAVEAVSDRVEWVLQTAWQNEFLTQDDFEGLLAASPAPFRPSGEGFGAHLLALGAWALVAWGVGVARVRRVRIDP